MGKTRVKWNESARTRTAAPSSTTKISASTTRPKTKSRIAALRESKATALSSPSDGVTLPDWLRVGSYVRLTWDYDPAYGVGEGSFEGRVKELDGWILVWGPGGVQCHMPLSQVKTFKRAPKPRR